MHYYAKEVAKIIGTGITSKRVGMIATNLNLKTDKYGIWVEDRISPNPTVSFTKSVFKYNDLGVDVIKSEWIKISSKK